jgi:dUTP pyrophosphatase
MPLIYVAGAVDMANHNHTLKQQACDMLRENGFSVYRPWRAFDAKPPVSESEARAILNTNLAAIEQADGMLVVLDGKTFTWGTAVDVQHADDVQTPVVIWWATEQPVPVYLRATNRLSLSLATAIERLQRAASPERVRVPPGQLSVAGWRTGEARTVLPVAVEDGHLPPSKAYDDDAGIDLYVKGNHVIYSHQWVDVEVGTRVAIPAGYFGLVLGRSSTFYTKGLDVHTAVIDAGWRGPLKVAIYNPSNDVVKISDKERVAQVVLIPIRPVDVVLSETLPPGSRGEQGFGSSGR